MKKAKINRLLSSLSSLLCFTNITRINTITGGLSNPCFKVEADGNDYFAKKTNVQLFETELYLTNILAKQAIAPTVIYFNNQWIISQFISGTNLTESQLTLAEKIEISISLMANFHQLVNKTSDKNITDLVPRLHIINAINDLLTPQIEPSLQDMIKQMANVMSELIIPEITSSKAILRCCHGDINFSNVLFDDNQRPWLIDFEYACIAPIEFDIAMLLAVNNIQMTELNQVITCYEKVTNIALSNPLCHYFLALSYLINGLWYYSQHLNKPFSAKSSTSTPTSTKNPTSPNFLSLAKQQWQLYDQLINHLSLAIREKKLATLI
jgi:thiamine kinase-like enzyme